MEYWEAMQFDVFRLYRLIPLHCSQDIIMILMSRSTKWVKISECTKFNRIFLRRKAFELPRHRWKNIDIMYTKGIECNVID